MKAESTETCKQFENLKGNFMVASIVRFNRGRSICLLILF